MHNKLVHRRGWLLGAALVVAAGGALGILVLLKPDSSPDPVSGMTLFAGHCAACHGAAGEGLFGTPPLNDPDVCAKSAGELRDTVARGSNGTAMIAYSRARGGTLGERDLDDLVAMIRQCGWAAVAARVEALGFTPPPALLSALSAGVQAQIAALPDGPQLVSGLQVYAGRCATCHGGSGEGTVAAPAVNSPDLRADNTPDDLRAIIADGVPDTRMAAWSSELSAGEIDATLALLLRWAEIDALGLDLAVEVAPLDLNGADAGRGATLFKTLCTRCHGSRGQGSLIAPALNDPVFLRDTPPRTLYEIIRMGVADTLMAGWAGYLDDQEILSLVAYLQTWTAPAAG